MLNEAKSKYSNEDEFVELLNEITEMLQEKYPYLFNNEIFF